MGTFGGTLISFLELIVLAVSVVLLGWIGVGIFLLTNVIAFLAVSVRLAMGDAKASTGLRRVSGRTWDRTRDLPRVKRALSR